MASIEVRGLVRHFGDVEAVRGLSFDVAAGELFGLVGPDGAGKTTTLRMLAGVLRPSAGDAVLGGLSVVKDPEGVKQRIAYMAQRFGLYTDLTVRENIDFYADLYQVPRAERPARLERLFGFSGLGPFEKRLAGQLSGGMRQKLSLCCALVHHPDILLLDEPTFGVDPISRRDLWLIVHEMVATGTTVVVSTAYLDEAERCDRVALLHEGQLLALDRPAALQEGLDGRLLAITASDPRAALAVLRQVPAVRAAALFGQAVHAMLVPGTPADELLGALARAGQVGATAVAIEPALEDVFIERVTAPDAHA